MKFSSPGHVPGLVSSDLASSPGHARPHRGGGFDSGPGGGAGLDPRAWPRARLALASWLTSFPGFAPRLAPSRQQFEALASLS